MRTTFDALLALDRPLLADGATGTNYFEMGLGPGDPPELWNIDHPERVSALHGAFVAAGADIILTNTFGCNRYRLKLHNAGDRAHEIAQKSAEIASLVAATAHRPVLVAGSIGPTGELIEPLGSMTEAEAFDAFVEEIQGLVAGGADVAWIETKSAAQEMRAAALAAIHVGIPYTVTASFDTAGRTMMGLRPTELIEVFAELPVPPVAIGANCGVGASDLLVAIQQMTGLSIPIIAKSNCGIPQFKGTEIEYTGNPMLMGHYAELAIDSGALIIGGCCGTSPEHLAEMRRTIDLHERGDIPSIEHIVATTGPLTNTKATAAGDGPVRQRTGRRRGSNSSV